MKFKLVDTIPNEIDNDVLYISEDENTTVHKCACGCGNSIILPIGTLNWSVSIDTNCVSMYPEVNNSGFDCKASYWIKEGNIVWIYY